MENKQEKSHNHKWWCCCSSGSNRVGFGVFLLFVGSYFIAQDLGFISYDISFWSVVLVALGVYYIFGKSRH